MRNFSDEFSTNFPRAAFDDLLSAGTFSGTALLIEHLALWNEPLRLPPPASYVVGTATLGAAFTWWCQRHGCTQAAVAFWGIAGIGGAVVSTAYWARHVARKFDHRAFLAGSIAAPRLTPAPRPRWEEEEFRHDGYHQSTTAGNRRSGKSRGGH